MINITKVFFIAHSSLSVILVIDERRTSLLLILDATEKAGVHSCGTFGIGSAVIHGRPGQVGESVIGTAALHARLLSCVHDFGP